jgi:hypothetical protein
MRLAGSHPQRCPHASHVSAGAPPPHLQRVRAAESNAASAAIPNSLSRARVCALVHSGASDRMYRGPFSPTTRARLPLQQHFRSVATPREASHGASQLMSFARLIFVVRRRHPRHQLLRLGHSIGPGCLHLAANNARPPSTQHGRARVALPRHRSVHTLHSTASYGSYTNICARRSVHRTSCEMVTTPATVPEPGRPALSLSLSICLSHHILHLSHTPRRK